MKDADRCRERIYLPNVSHPSRCVEERGHDGHHSTVATGSADGCTKKTPVPPEISWQNKRPR